jgi:hypothetical protein
MPYPSRHFVPQLGVRIVITRGKEIISGGIESHGIVPRPARVRGSNSHHSAKDIRVISDQIIWSDSREIAY